MPTPQSQERSSLRAGPSKTIPARAPSVTSTSLSLSTSHTPRSSTSSIPTTHTSTIVVEEGRSYVVVRGDYPGVYTDKCVPQISAHNSYRNSLVNRVTAFAMAGRHPGVKVRACKTYTDAQKYYARAEAKGEVGMPMFARELPQ